MVTLHDLVPWEDILEHPCQYMVNSRHAIGSWGTFKKNEFRATLALTQGFLKNVTRFPQMLDTLFQ
jgi:hypothetical protein